MTDNTKTQLDNLIKNVKEVVENIPTKNFRTYK